MDKLSLFINTENLLKQGEKNPSNSQIKSADEVYICSIMVQLWHVFFQMSLEQVMVTVNSDVHNNSTASDNNRRGKAMPF